MLPSPPGACSPVRGMTPAPRSDPQPIAGAQAGAIQEGSLEMAFGDQTLRTSAPGDEAASHRVRPWMNSGDFVTVHVGRSVDVISFKSAQREKANGAPRGSSRSSVSAAWQAPQPF